jgi:hypothetical protein
VQVVDETRRKRGTSASRTENTTYSVELLCPTRFDSQPIVLGLFQAPKLISFGNTHDPKESRLSLVLIGNGCNLFR